MSFLLLHLQENFHLLAQKMRKQSEEADHHHLQHDNDAVSRL